MFRRIRDYLSDNWSVANKRSTRVSNGSLDLPTTHQLLSSHVGTLVKLLQIADRYTVDSPSLYPALYRNEVKVLIERYEQELSPAEAKQTGHRAAEIIGGQRAQELDYITDKDEELKAIIAIIAAEIQTSADRDQAFTETISRSVKQLDEAVDIDDIRQLRQKITDEVGFLTRQVQLKKTQDQTRMLLMEEQIQILNSKLDTAEQQTKTDTLTSLFNRRAFDEHLLAEICLAKHKQQPLSLVIIDIDHFKKVNDTFGHLVGDEILTKTAELIIKAFFRKSDFVARYGGEEFAVIQSQTNIAAAKKSAEELRSRMTRATIPTESGEVPITISAGITDFQGDESHSEFVARADKALYQAKESGRNQVIALSLDDQ